MIGRHHVANAAAANPNVKLELAAPTSGSHRDGPLA